jgi:hypothetical protein
MMRIIPMTIAAMAVLALASPASAAHRHHKRVHSETGPLIMSGTMVPYSARRARASAAICRPVTIRVR